MPLQEKGELIMKKFNPFVSFSFVFFSLLVFPCYAKTSQEAKDTLAQMKMTYSEGEFFECARLGKTDAIKLFLDAGMNPNAKDSRGLTALIWGAAGGYTDIVKALLDKGADVNATSKIGWTALMSAAFNGHTDTLLVLLTKGAKVNAKTNSGETVLMFAAQNGNTETVQTLLAKGADVNAKMNDGK